MRNKYSLSAAVQPPPPPPQKPHSEMQSRVTSYEFTMHGVRLL